MIRVALSPVWLVTVGRSLLLLGVVLVAALGALLMTGGLHGLWKTLFGPREPRS